MKSQKLLVIETYRPLMTITDIGIFYIAVQKDYHDICSRYTKGKQSEVGTQTRMKG